MTDRHDTLVERVEKATGPDYGLFEDAFAFCFPNHYMPGRSGFGPSRWKQFKTLLDVGAWLDAAMTLVPEGWTYEAYQGPSGRPHKWKLRMINDGDKFYTEREGKAATPALALTVAALRARAAQEAKRPDWRRMMKPTDDPITRLYALADAADPLKLITVQAGDLRALVAEHRTSAEPSDECQHKGNLNQGPRIPLRYGSAATVICQACGRWKQDRPGFENGPWKTQSELEEALKEDDEI